MTPEHNPSPQSKPNWTRFFRDPEGRIVIAQFPNWPLWVWLAATVLEQTLDGADGLALARLISFAAIVYWAYLEIVAGVNPFRKWLGGSVLLFVLYSRLSSQFLS
jgi:hypothetical protein